MQVEFFAKKGDLKIWKFEDGSQLQLIFKFPNFQILK